MNKLGSLASIALALLSSCGSEVQDDPDEAETQVGTHVRCGCSIEGIGACGEYVEVGGEMVELVLPADVDLGLMPFCGKDGLMADVEGGVVEDKYVATRFALIAQQD